MVHRTIPEMRKAVMDTLLLLSLCHHYIFRVLPCQIHLICVTLHLLLMVIKYIVHLWSYKHVYILYLHRFEF